ANKAAVEQKLAECRALTPPPAAAPVQPEPTPAAPPIPPPAPAPVPAPAPAMDSLPPQQETSAPSPPLAESPGPRAWYRDPVALALLGTGVVASGVGTGFLVSAQSLSNQSKAAGQYTDARDLKDQARRRGKIGLVSAIAGGALIGGGVVWIVLHR